MEIAPIYIHKQVKSIVFGVLGPKMIKSMSSAKIVTPELYDKEGYPVDGGLMDTRLGVIDPGLKCKTCSSKLKECIGHFGYIEMARPVIHIKFVNQIYDALRCTCSECGRILMPEEKLDKSLKRARKLEEEESVDARRKFTKELVNSLKNFPKCPHCKAKVAKITIEKPSTFMEGDKRLSPIEIRTRLEKINDVDAELLGYKPGFVRPDWMVLTVLPIPPVTMRPSITLETGERSEDDLTHKLGDIVRINQRLFENINAGAPEIIIEDLWDLLQYHVTTFFDNEVAQLPPARHRSGQPLKTISERIKSKEGRIRHNLAGKRTNFSARTVISPDPMLHLNEVGVPEVIATKLTVPERVTEWNMQYLKKFVEKGAGKYPGANYILRPDGKKKKITDDTKEQLMEELQPGYIVERHLMDGDVAIFNRQPSLHRMSMMCHKIRVLPYKTLRLNPAVCRPYNADFDGDEMNLHIPQTEEARAEAEVLMMVQTQLISPRYGLSVIKCIQDSVSGNYILTKNMSYPKAKAIDMLYKVGIDDFSRLPNKKNVSGNEVFSSLLPRDFNYKNKTLKGDDVVIENGSVTSGYIDGVALGGDAGDGLLLRALHKKYGDSTTINIIDQFSKLGIKVLEEAGLTTAISDTDLSPDVKEKISNTLEQAYTDVDSLIEDYHAKRLEILPGRSLRETVELRILERLNKARNQTGIIVTQNSHKTSGTAIMADSGARGKSIHMAQMAACVGQQAMRGKRIEKGYKNRTLSMFKKDDLGTAAHGFVGKSFSDGLTPFEFYFINMTGRDALMDTALRTPKSGYLYRRLANAMQDLKVEYDNTVRDASGKIVQFSYGEDGIDVSKSEGGTIDIQKIIEEL